MGTAVVLFPLVKRQSETLALGFVTARLFEAAIIAVGSGLDAAPADVPR